MEDFKEVNKALKVIKNVVYLMLFLVVRMMLYVRAQQP